jgi:hypothetical protein
MESTFPAMATMARILSFLDFTKFPGAVPITN